MSVEVSSFLVSCGLPCMKSTLLVTLDTSLLCACKNQVFTCGVQYIYTQGVSLVGAFLYIDKGTVVGYLIYTHVGYGNILHPPYNEQ